VYRQIYSNNMNLHLYTRQNRIAFTNTMEVFYEKRKGEEKKNADNSFKCVSSFKEYTDNYLCVAPNFLCVKSG
jgi:hypothetical protein